MPDNNTAKREDLIHYALGKTGQHPRIGLTYNRHESRAATDGSKVVFPAAATDDDFDLAIALHEFGHLAQVHRGMGWLVEVPALEREVIASRWALSTAKERGYEPTARFKAALVEGLRSHMHGWSGFQARFRFDGGERAHQRASALLEELGEAHNG